MLSHFGFFVFRRPLKSVELLNNFNSGLSDTTFEASIRKWYADNPLACEALFISSPSLHERVTKMLSGEAVSEKEKLLLTLYKFLIRMSTRSTPYGLFAGITFGRILEKTRATTGSEAQRYAKVTLDHESIIGIKNAILRHPETRSQLSFFPNSTLYQIGDDFRFVEEQYQDTNRNYYISSIRGSEFINLILRRSEKGALFDELVAEIILKGIGKNEAVGFLNEMVRNKILVSDIEPTIIGRDYLELTTTRLAAMHSINDMLPKLKFLQLLDHKKHGLVTYMSLREGLELLTNRQDKQFLVVNSYFPSQDTSISENAVKNILAQISDLSALNQGADNSDLSQFKQRFQARYEADEIPLTLALDVDTGIGYGGAWSAESSYTPLIDDLLIPTTSTLGKNSNLDWWNDLILNFYTHTVRGNLSIINLSESDIKNITNKKRQNEPLASERIDWENLPYCFNIFGSLMAESFSHVDRQDFLFQLISCTGPSAINILSRFHDGDDVLKSEMQNCALAEMRHSPDVIFAEIAHCPDLSVTNVMSRPTLYDYEIPYLGKSSAPHEYQIPITDLLISVQSNTVILRSRRLNRRIIPRLSNAHNYRGGLPIYKFLCDLQNQGQGLNIRWNWSILVNQAFLPRVQYKNIIICRASWLIEVKSIITNDVHILKLQLKHQGIPKEFVIVSGDNELLIDSAIQQSMELFLLEVKKRVDFRVFEVLVNATNCLLTDGVFQYSNELVIPLKNEFARPISGVSSQSPGFGERKFSIGSKWLYMKIYLGEKSADSVLVHEIFPVIQKLLSENIIKQFFYVRYSDTDTHLRLRFLGDHHLGFYQHVIRAIQEKLKKHVVSGVVSKIQIDTYHRELERYGEGSIDICESIFHLETINILKFLSQQVDAFDETLRIAYAFVHINRILEWANLSIDEKSQFLNLSNDHFFNEFRGDNELRKSLNIKYRWFRHYLNLNIERTETSFADPLAHYIKELRVSINNSEKLFSVLASLIHMSVNRLFPSRQKTYELIIYHCMAKHFKSERARLYNLRLIEQETDLC